MPRYWSAPMHVEYPAHPYSVRGGSHNYDRTQALGYSMNHPRSRGQSRGHSMLRAHPQSNSSQFHGHSLLGAHPQSNTLGQHCAASGHQPLNGTRIHNNFRYYNNPWQRNYSHGRGDIYKCVRVESNDRVSHTEDAGSVILKKLPFFDVVSTLLEVEISNKGMPLVHHNFIIKSDEVNYFKNQNSTNLYQIQLRICKFDSTSEQMDYFPSLFQVAVNNDVCKLPGMEIVPRGRAGPVDITDKCNFSTNTKNIVTIRRPSEKLKLFVQCVKKITSQDLIERLKAKTTVIPEVTASKIKDKLKEDQSGDEIASTTLHCSLLCPLGKTRMKLPCRASTCSHFQCFDAVIYLQMNECKQKWRCPVCFQPAMYDHLQVDGYFTSILEHNSDTDKIILLADGSWQPLSAADKRQQQQPIENICDDAQVKDIQCAQQNITVDLDSEEDINSYERTENILDGVFGESLDLNKSNAESDAHAAVETITLSDDESFLSTSQISDPGFGFSSTPLRFSMRTRRSNSFQNQNPNITDTTQLFASSTPLHSVGRTLGDFLVSPEPRRSKRNARGRKNTKRNSIVSSTDNRGSRNMESTLSNSENCTTSRSSSNSKDSRMNNKNNSQNSMDSCSVSSESGNIINLTEDIPDSFYSESDVSGASYIPLRLSGACASSRRARRDTINSRHVSSQRSTMVLRSAVRKPEIINQKSRSGR